VADFMVEVASKEGVSARALEFTILTAARTGEVIGARWDEIDLAGGVWKVPADRMKGKREHRVPLSAKALAILHALPREGDYVFVGTRLGTAISNMAMAAVLKRMGHADITVHGFRSTFRDWAGDCTSHPNHVVEMALAHAIGDKVEAAYRRSDLFLKRRRLMSDWTAFLSRPSSAKTVTPMRPPRTQHG